MKKFIALLLALCMMAVMLPAFAALSFADSAATPAAEPSLEALLEGREQIALNDSSFNGIGTKDGFLDGNVLGVQSVKELLGVNTNAEMCEKVVPYVNGAKARFNNSYKGYTHCGISGWDGGVWIGVVGAGFTKGETCTLTLLLGDHYYMQRTFEAEATALATESEKVVYFDQGDGCDVTVVMADEDHGITVGETLAGCTHDECGADRPRYTFTVTKVDGKTVTMRSDDFKSDNTLLELTRKDDTKIALTINKLAHTNSVKSYVQFRENANDPYNTYSARFIVEAYQPWLDSQSGSASLSLSFATKEGGTKTYTATLTEVFQKITAGGETYTPGADSVLFGVQVTKVPFGTKTVTGTLIIGDQSIPLGSASMNDNAMLTTRPGYGWVQGEKDIVATSGKNTGFESAERLFDKSGEKYLLNKDQKNAITDGDKITDTVTWHYNRSVTVAMYEVFSGNDTGSDRSPKGWRLYGSPDGQTGWTLIDAQSAPDGQDHFDINEDGRGKTFTVQTPVAYQYYKIEIDLNGNDNFQIAEIMLYEKNPDGFDWSKTKAFDAPASYSADPNYDNVGKVFDDKPDSKYEGNRKEDGTATITWRYDSTETAVGYSVMTAYDDLRWGRYPDSWILYGKNGDGEWTVLDEVKYTKHLSGEENFFTIDNPAAYSEYKIVFVAGNDYFQVDNIKLYKAQ